MSTGYFTKHQFVKHQPTSSGQAVNATTGVHVDIKDGGALTVETNGTISVSSGVTPLFKDVQVMATTSTGGAIRRHGLTIIRNITTDNMNYSLPAPVMGVSKELLIVSNTSKFCRITVSSSGHYFGSSGYYSVVFSSDIKLNQSGLCGGKPVTFYSTGTKRWLVMRNDKDIGITSSSGLTT